MHATTRPFHGSHFMAQASASKELQRCRVGEVWRDEFQGAVHLSGFAGENRNGMTTLFCWAVSCTQGWKKHGKTVGYPCNHDLA